MITQKHKCSHPKLHAYRVDHSLFLEWDVGRASGKNVQTMTLVKIGVRGVENGSVPDKGGIEVAN